MEGGNIPSCACDIAGRLFLEQSGEGEVGDERESERDWRGAWTYLSAGEPGRWKKMVCAPRPL